jgi:hypothetical protein
MCNGFKGDKNLASEYHLPFFYLLLHIVPCCFLYMHSRVDIRMLGMETVCDLVESCVVRCH